MRRALRLLPPLSQPRPPTSRLLLQSSAPAGPSRIPYFSIRSYVTPQTNPSVTPFEPIDNIENTRSAKIPFSETQVDDLVLPPNVRFEGFTQGEGIAPPKDPGGPILHYQDSPLDPISLSISSLASNTPTLAAPEGKIIELPPTIFGQPLRRDILHRCVVWFLSTLRKGNQSTRTRSTVSYSGRKLRQQKGTGKARVGDASSGIRRGGAPLHPLSPRDHAQLIPRKIRALGLAIALSSKLSTGLLRVVPDLNEAKWDGTNAARRALTNQTIWTRVPGEDYEEADVIERFGKSQDLSILFIQSPLRGRSKREAFERVVRNIEGIEVMNLDAVEVYHVLKYRWCVMDQEAVTLLGGTLESLESIADEVPLEPEESTPGLNQTI